jgi:hypothetical protein
MPLLALLRKRHYGTGLSVATAPAHPLSLPAPRPELRPHGLRANTKTVQKIADKKFNA